MNTRNALIYSVLEKLSEYEEVSADQSLEGFIEFLHVGKSHTERRMIGGNNEPELRARGAETENSIAILISHIYRYARLYTKKALSASPMRSPDDFSYLVVLITYDSLTKTELIEKNIHEKTTGIEIINRLLKAGLIEQVDNPEDKRSKRVAITAEGRKAVMSVIDNLSKVSAIMTANLSEIEKGFLSQVLYKLDRVHYDVFQNDRGASLEEIHSKLSGA